MHKKTVGMQKSGGREKEYNEIFLRVARNMRET